jgi:uroporphyrinogen decarboxylase
MQSIDRVTALLQGKSIDRIPVWPIVYEYGAKDAGYPLTSIYSSAEKSFQSQMLTREKYGYDGWPQYVYTSYGAWEFGESTRFITTQGEQAPVFMRQPIESEKVVETLKLPDVQTAGMFPMAIEFSKLQRSSGLPATITLGGVFTLAANICALDKLCYWLVKRPKLIHKILRLATNYLVNVVQYWVDSFGAENTIVWIQEPVAANNVISPSKFQQFVLPYQKEANEKILATGIKHIICHICGPHSLNLPYWAQIPLGDPGIATFGHEVGLTSAIKYLGDQCIIAGNINPYVIETGTPEQVYGLCKQCIEEAKYAPRGFILMSGCEVTPMSPPNNLYKLVEAANDFGWY